MPWHLGLAMFWVLVLAPRAGALSIEKQFDQFGRSWWDRSDGLPQNAVLALARTDPGYLWIGTQEGLVRFDGERMRVFDADNVEALGGSFITSLADGGGGVLWIGTRNGLVRFDGSEFEAVELRSVPGVERPYVRSLLVDDRRLWIGLSGAGLLQLDPSSGEVRRVDAVPADAVVRSLSLQGSTLWVGSARGLLQLAEVVGDGTSRVTSRLSGRSVRSLVSDDHGRLWVGLDNGELLRSATIGTNAGQAPVLARVLSGLGSVSDLIWDRSGALWVATSAGVYRLGEGLELEALTEVEVDAAPAYALLQDEAGSIWAGTRSGLLQLRDGPVTVLGPRQGLADPLVRVVGEDQVGRLWVGTRGGLSLRSATEGAQTLRRVDLPAGVVGVRTLSLERDGLATEVWLGTRSELLVGRVDDSDAQASKVSWRTVGRFEAPLTSVAVAEGIVLVGTQGEGLFASTDRGSTWKRREAADGSGPRVVRVVREQSGASSGGGSYWVGSEEGLFEWDGSVLRRLELRDDTAASPVAVGNDEPIVLDLLPGDGGDLWIGTAHHGLGLLSSEDHVTWFSRADGLFDDLVFRVLDDGRGSLWLTSNRGVSRVSIAELRARRQERGQGDAGEPLSRRWLDESDGMLDAECNGGTQPAGWVDRSGQLWVPTVRGLARFDPDEVDGSGTLPRVWIEQVWAGRREVDLTAGVAITVPSERRSLRVEFASASYLSSLQSRFEVRLEGFEDGTWRDVGSQRSVDYSALPPGDYVFQVRSVSRFGTRSAIARLPVRVPTLLWERPWFLLCVIVAAALAGLLLGRLRVRALRQAQQQLEEVVSQRTEDLAQANRELERLATLDPLTGVANQRRLWAELPREWSRASRTKTPLGCLMVDLDHFKKINDRHGHQRGDAALQRVAEILRTQVRREGELVGRSGGDEFVVIIPGADLEEAVRVGDRICNQVAASGEALAQLRGDDEAVHVTVSVGAASCVPRAEISPETLLEAADRALYRAKEAGRNTVSN